jgi:hypothetical protein
MNLIQVVALVIVVFMIFCFPFLIEYGDFGAEYQLQLPVMTNEQCQFASSSIRDMKFLEVRTEIDPCTLENVYYYCYKVTWKTDAKEWLEAYLAKDGIVPISVETYEGSKVNG